MKRLLLIAIILLSFNFAHSQIALTTFLVNDSTTNFVRFLPANSLILNKQDNRLFRLITPATNLISLEQADKQLLNADFNEIDPIWNSEKASYVTSSFLTSQNYLTSYTESDPIWLSEKANYVTSSFLSSQNYLTSFTESDPVWLSEKANYVTSAFLSSQNYLTSFTESDPVWLSEKASYTTIQMLSDTAAVLRANSGTVIVDSSNLWLDNGTEIVLNSGKPLIVGNKQIYQFSKTSNSASFQFLDSIYIEPGKVVNLDVIAIGYTAATAGSFEHKVAFSNLNGSLNQISTYNWSHYQRDDNNWIFHYSVSGNYIRFVAKGSDETLINWKINVELIIN